MEPTTPKAEREILSIYYNYLHLAGKSLKSPALERIGPGERIFAEYSVTAPATRISKPLRIHGNFVGPSGGESVFVPRKWRRKGNRQRETLCLLLSNIFNVFLGAEPFHDNADIALGGMVLAHGAANIADQPLGWYPHG
ncbi:MAG: hypothetical protein ACK5TI_01245 [bacterium]